MDRYIFDTSAIIAYLKLEPGSIYIERLFMQIENNEMEGYISSLTLTELIYILGPKNINLLFKILAYIEESKLNVINVTEHTAKHAGVLRMRYKNLKLSIVDCVILAAALINKMNKAITKDKNWIKVKEAPVFLI